MIENGISLEKDDQETTIETTTALEIHQIHHNVIRTNRFRQLTAPEIRRNSTTSSVSGNSAMIISARENEATPTSTGNNFVSPRPIVRPIQIKVEPADPDESPVTSSPSNSSEPSVQTVYSSKPPSEKPSPPMVVINGVFNKESTQDQPKKTPKPSTAAPLSVKLGRPRLHVSPRASATKAKQVVERPRPNLRAVRKKDEARKSKRKLKAVIKKVAKATSKQKQKELKKTPKKTNLKKDKRPEPPKKRGRPRKDPNTPPTKYKKKQPQKTSGRS